MIKILDLKLICERCKKTFSLDYNPNQGISTYIGSLPKLYKRESHLHYVVDPAKPKEKDRKDMTFNEKIDHQNRLMFEAQVASVNPSSRGVYFVHSESKYCFECEDIVQAAIDEAMERAGDEAEKKALVI